MKILEVNSFMTWARGYEDGHEVVRWLSKSRDNGQIGSKKSRGESLRQGWQFFCQGEKAGFDLVICGAFGRSYRAGFDRHLKYLYEKVMVGLVCRIARRAKVPLLVVDISDDSSFHPVNTELLRKAHIVFKRELPVDPYLALESFRFGKARMALVGCRKQASWQDLVRKLQPISLGCREEEPQRRFVPIAERDWDVFYAGNDGMKPRRSGVREALEKLTREGYRVNCPTCPLSLTDYFDAMARSVLTISPPGLGWDCHRHYEAAMVGSVVVTPFPTILRDEPLLGGIHALFYDPEKDLTEEIRGILSGCQHSLEEIGKAGQDHVWKKHTHTAHFSKVISLATSQKS